MKPYRVARLYGHVVEEYHWGWDRLVKKDGVLYTKGTFEQCIREIKEERRKRANRSAKKK